MPYYKFGIEDVFYNTIKTHPESTFIIYSGSIYYNNRRPHSSSVNGGWVLHVDGQNNEPVLGSISLYELNVERPIGGLIYPYVTKDGSLTTFKTVSTASFNEFNYGDTITSEYPLTASIQREFIHQTSSTVLSDDEAFLTASRHIRALKFIR